MCEVNCQIAGKPCYNLLTPLLPNMMSSEVESWFRMEADSSGRNAFPRLFFGKTKVMAKAMGDSPSTEPYPGTSLLLPHLSGAVGLLFTPRDPASIQDYFASFCPMDYARAGTTATRSFVLPAGTLYSRGGDIDASEDVPVGHSVEPNLRKLGVPTRLIKGKVELEREFEVCKEGDTLGSGQTTLLKMFGVATAEFRVGIRAYWEAATGDVKAVGTGDDSVEDVKSMEI